MKHLAIRSLSICRANYPYTCPGLGDRIHSVTLGYLWGRSMGGEEPVTIHITADKYDKAHKPPSWAEIINLFPAGSVAVQAHGVQGLQEDDWLAYLRGKGLDAQPYWYSDGGAKCRFDRPEKLDASQWLKNLPLLTPSSPYQGVSTPFITTQWDSQGNGPGRKIPPPRRRAILDAYRARGMRVITIGKESSDPALGPTAPLADIGATLAQASAHVGVDSGMMHLAQLYLPWKKIHIYTNRFISHHTTRAQLNGSPINLHG